MNTPFHLALPCNDIAATREFYVDILEAQAGRSAENWIDINLFGHQLTFTNAGDFKFDFKNYRFNQQILPSFHFGIIVGIDIWGSIYSNLLQKEVEITTEVTFLEHKIGEHLSFFVSDPNGYRIEFKSFKNEEDVFAQE